MWEDIAAKTVLDAAGESVELQAVWASQPTLFVFVRHFG